MSAQFLLGTSQRLFCGRRLRHGFSVDLDIVPVDRGICAHQECLTGGTLVDREVCRERTVDLIFGPFHHMIASLILCHGKVLHRIRLHLLLILFGVFFRRWHFRRRFRSRLLAPFGFLRLYRLVRYRLREGERIFTRSPAIGQQHSGQHQRDDHCGASQRNQQSLSGLLLLCSSIQRLHQFFRRRIAVLRF